MASIILPLALGGSRKADGTVNAGGLVFLSLSGSPNSSVTGYLDRDKNAAATLDGGGYRLDQAGKIALFIDTTCKVIVQDTNGVNVDSFVYEVATNAGLVEILNPGFTGVSPTSGALVAGGRSTLDTALSSLYSSLGGLDGKYRGVYGTADTNVKTEIEQLGLTPQRFGAKGDGVTDDTNALQNMANAQSASGLPVFLPRGTYKISSVITFGNAVVMRGIGPTTSGSYVLTTNASQDALIFGTNADVSDLLVSPSAACSGTGIKCGTASRFTNVFVGTTGFVYATAFNNTSSTSLAPAVAVSCQVGGATSTVGAWVIDGAFGGTQSVTTAKFGQNISSTQTVATAGTVAPVLPTYGGGTCYNRIIGTTNGGSASITTAFNTLAISAGVVLVFELQAPAGGTFTFTFLAGGGGFKGPSLTTGAITASQRQVWTFAWNPYDQFYVLMSSTATFA